MDRSLLPGLNAQIEVVHPSCTLPNCRGWMHKPKWYIKRTLPDRRGWTHPTQLPCKSRFGPVEVVVLLAVGGGVRFQE